MADFTITEDFPKSEIEFDQRFSDPHRLNLNTMDCTMTNMQKYSSIKTIDFVP